MKSVPAIAIFLCATACGCAHLDFGQEKGFQYYNAKPMWVISTDKDCSYSVTKFTVPDTTKPHIVKLVPGIFGSGNLSVTVADGMLTTVGQQHDTKASDSASALGTIAKAAGVGAAATVSLKLDQKTGESKIIDLVPEAALAGIEPCARGVYVFDPAGMTPDGKPLKATKVTLQ